MDKYTDKEIRLITWLMNKIAKEDKFIRDLGITEFSYEEVEEAVNNPKSVSLFLQQCEEKRKEQATQQVKVSSKSKPAPKRSSKSRQRQ